MRIVLRLLCCLLPLAANAQPTFHLRQQIQAQSGSGGPPPGVALYIYESGDGNTLDFRATNTDSTTYALDVSMSLDNMQASAPLPYKGNLPANSLRERALFSITRMDISKPFYYGNMAWHLSSIPYSSTGNGLPLPNRAIHYRYPWPPGKSFAIGNAYHGYGGHLGQWGYAVDFVMPVGSPVTAARDGEVVGVQDSFAKGGNDPALADKANYVYIQHADGTVGRYLHIMPGGAKVRPGQKVKVGDLIALSGNVGWSTEPHLHFDVITNPSGDPHTIPLTFVDPDGTTFTPTVGMTLSH